MAVFSGVEYDSKMASHLASTLARILAGSLGIAGDAR